MKPSTHSLGLIVLLMALAVVPLPASTLYWAGTGSNWSTASNWSTSSSATTPSASAQPGASDDAIFNISTVNTDQSVILSGSKSANSLTFVSTGATTLSASTSTTRILNVTGGVTVDAGAGAVTIGASGKAINYSVTSSQSFTNNSASLLTIVNFVSSGAGGTQTVTVNGAGSGGTTFAGPSIVKDSSGALALVIDTTGGGTTTFAGNNQYSGGTTVTSGTLALGSANALASSTGALTVNGGTLISTVAGTNLGGSLAISGGSIALNGSAAGSITLAGGSGFTITGGTVNFKLGTSFDQIIGTGPLILSGGTFALDTSGAGFSYGNHYQIFSGFVSTAFSSVTLTGYDTADFMASVADDGLLSFAAVPEPSTCAALTGLVVLGLAWRRRRP